MSTNALRESELQTLPAMEWRALKKAAELGDAQAQCALGFYFECGVASRSGKVLANPDRAQAICWHLRAADQGWAGSKTDLSRLFSEADPPDISSAIAWATAAIAQGQASAAYNLGIMYRDLGQPKRALRYYRLAATMGDAGAYLQVGALLVARTRQPNRLPCSTGML